VSLALRKSKMVSFRLSPEEYRRIREMCAAQGMRSVSDLARTAMLKLVASENHTDPLTYEVRDLRDQIRSISQALERISHEVEERKPQGSASSSAGSEI